MPASMSQGSHAVKADAAFVVLHADLTQLFSALISGGSPTPMDFSDETTKACHVQGDRVLYLSL